MDASDGYRTLAELLDLAADLGVDVSTVETRDDGDALQVTVELELSRDGAAGAPESEPVSGLDGEPSTQGSGDHETNGRAEADPGARGTTEPPEAETTADGGPPTAAARSGPPGDADADGEGGDGEAGGDEVGPGGASDPGAVGEAGATTDAPTADDTEGTPAVTTEGGPPDVDEPGDGESAADTAEPDDGPTFHQCTVEGCERTFGTEHGMRIHVGRVHAEDEGEESDDASAPDAGAGTAIDTSGEGEGEDEDEKGQTDPELDDAVDLPEGLCVADLEGAVKGSKTLREVANGLGVEREEARTLLDEFGLLEMVHGRVATRDERERSKAEIRDRIRRHASGD